MSSGELTITKIEAFSLGKSHADDDVSKTTPYVLFEIGNDEHKTKKEKKAGSEVSWEGESIVLKTASGDSLSVSVIHKRHLLSDTVIGKGTITLAELGENGPVEVKLSEPKSGTPAGTLKFSVTGNHNLGYPKTATIKGSTGDNPSGISSGAPAPATAGFAGAGAEAHSESGVQTGRAFPKDGSSPTGTGGISGSEGAAIGAGAAGAAAAGAGAAGAYRSDTHTGTGIGGVGSDFAGKGSGPSGAAGAYGSDAHTGTGTGGVGSDLAGKGSGPSGAASGASTGTGAPAQTYTEAAKQKAAGATDFTTQKLQDLKVGLVGEQGAAKAEGKTTDVPATGAQPGYIDKAKEGAAYLITKTQDALEYTKERVIGTGAPGTAGESTTAPAAGTTSSSSPTV